ncbi:hypothetical protein MJO28_017020 [Puccinia striiformis f. sp. tritici]|uniref:hypothetical protein n=1 Tax=Puccinia striiformis f. sp. tritici TaxID=168172 RepID=UPI000A12592E|nr:hypothetical protein Pst134EA_022782 [Puccinia striiformis f. sp. tritici]KAH9455311.1 hypothetical protein Pst134EA_022782 [Puccinia striiformis f. sp. tritici]KAI7934505.1 hypothetical protein MJO28_017020 [Puccinia striiformis f. sp. tritici]KAI9612266.1 hypothetical protein KEM48_004282 [Puccinia striiformis f. sp. tritici PST-130]
MTQQQLPPPEENEEPNHDLGEEPEDHDSSARVETRPQVAPKEDLIQPIRNSLSSGPSGRKMLLLEKVW